MQIIFFVALIFVSSSLNAFFWNIVPRAPKYTLILCVPNESKKMNRMIGNQSEKTIATQCVNILKEELEKFTRLSVIIKENETINTIEQISNINLINPDLFISLHFFQEANTQPHFFIYQTTYDPVPIQKPTPFALYTYDQSYLFNYQASHTLAFKIYTFLTTQHEKKFNYKSPIAFPFKPLIGITCPAIGIEIGLKNPNDWRECIPTLITALQSLFE